jgi:hypothetical protein
MKVLFYFPLLILEHDIVYNVGSCNQQQSHHKISQYKYLAFYTQRAQLRVLAKQKDALSWLWFCASLVLFCLSWFCFCASLVLFCLSWLCVCASLVLFCLSWLCLWSTKTQSR